MTAAVKRRLWIAVPLLSIFAGLGWFATDGIRDLSGTPSAWEEVSSEPFVRRIPASGELRSANAALIGCPPVQRKWNFTISEMAPEGSEVREGQPVLTFDAKELLEHVQIVQSRLNTAQSQLERTRIQQREQREQLVIEMAEAVANEARIAQKLDVPEMFKARVELEKLRLDKELADEELRLIALRMEAAADNERALVRSAENRLSKIQREIQEIQASIDAHRILSPRSGFVVHQANWQGDKPKVGESVSIGSSVMEIADLSQMELIAEVAEPDARWVAVDQRVEVRLAAAPDRVFHGRITEFGRLFREKSSEVPKMVFDVTIEIDEPDPDLLRPGMAAGVEILAPTEESVIQVPQSAIRVEQGRPVVTVISTSGSRTTVPVSLGDRWMGRVVVLDGLEVGSRIAVDGSNS